MLADDLAVDGAHLLQAGEVLVAVGDVPRQAHEVLGPRAASASTSTMLLQALRGLRDEVVGLELLLAVPPDHAAEVERAAGGGDAVGVATRRASNRLGSGSRVTMSCARSCQLPSKTGFSRATNALVRALEVGRLHADRLRLGLGLDGLLRAPCSTRGSAASW